MNRLAHLLVCYVLIVCSFQTVGASELTVGANMQFSTVAEAVAMADSGDKVCVAEGIYNEHDILIQKPILLEAEGHVLIDIDKKGYGLIIKADHVHVSGIRMINVGQSYTKDYAAIYIDHSHHFQISNTILEEVFFGILVEKSHFGLIRNNTISSSAVVESGAGNGIHMWYCSNVEVRDNELFNLRDGVYFEFVSQSIVRGNLSHDNLRYGLHFMFSNNDGYHDNIFKNNGSGVAVMFSKYVSMTGNHFLHNWGTASYGLLLKEIYDAEIQNNVFKENTTGILAEGSTRVNYFRNDLIGNGWAVKITGACYTNIFRENNFMNNSFDLSYNSKLNDNSFDRNFWNSYSGYDLDGDGLGDIPYRPVKLFTYVVNNTPEAIVLHRSMFVSLLNFSEKVSPIFTPDELKDNTPLMEEAR